MRVVSVPLRVSLFWAAPRLAPQKIFLLLAVVAQEIFLPFVAEAEWSSYPFHEASLTVLD